MAVKYLLSIVFIISIFLISSCIGSKSESQIENYKEELSSTASEFMLKLKNLLVSEMQRGGVISAVKVCSDTAQLFTKSIGEEKGLTIRRVSRKNRNPFNVPDNFELDALAYFERLHSEGKLTKETAYIQKAEEEGKIFIRYLKPITVLPECLGCHGSEAKMNPELVRLIDSLYPEDRGRNYAAGDLRGAVSIKKEIK